MTEQSAKGMTRRKFLFATAAAGAVAALGLGVSGNSDRGEVINEETLSDEEKELISKIEDFNRQIQNAGIDLQNIPQQRITAVSQLLKFPDTARTFIRGEANLEVKKLLRKKLEGQGKSPAEIDILVENDDARDLGGQVFDMSDGGHQNFNLQTQVGQNVNGYPLTLIYAERIPTGSNVLISKSIKAGSTLLPDNGSVSIVTQR